MGCDELNDDIKKASGCKVKNTRGGIKSLGKHKMWGNWILDL
jgi:hypothetical protein